MSDVLSIAASGLRAQSVRLGGVAQNTANMRSDGRPGVETGTAEAAYRPVRTVQMARRDGGVSAALAPQPGGGALRFAPAAPRANEAGMVESPNVSLTQQTAERIRAEAAYKAGVKVIQAQQSIDAALSESV